MDISTFSTLAGLVSLSLTLLIGLVAGTLYLRGGVGEKTATAQNSAISALQSELASLRRKADDEEKSRVKLEHVLDTIVSALKSQGIIITVQGELVQIETGEKRTVATIKIQDRPPA